VRIEVVLKGMLPSGKGFQGGERHILLQICLSRKFEETHVSPERKQSLLEGGGYNTLYHVEN
jgi:hypothetical protein